MRVQSVDFPWAFDKELFHEDVKTACRKNGLTVKDTLEILGLSASWSQPKNSSIGPTVANLLTVCSELDLDPRDYFVLALP